MTWDRRAPYTPESRKIRWEVVPYTRGRGLDLGCGQEKQYMHMIGVDNGHHQMFGQVIRPDVSADAHDLTLFGTNSLDFIFSSHLLEHFPYEEVPALLTEWMRPIKVGGHLLLYLPDEDTYPKVGEEGANPTHYWNVNQERVLSAMPDGFDLIDFQKRDAEDEYSLYFVFRKVGSGRHLSYQKYQRPKKTACVVRYGAFGDLLMASSVFAGLKKQGYHVTLMCTPPQSDCVKHDPHIDTFIYQDRDQVPNGALGEYWRYWAKKFDRFVNLSESVEGTFLAMADRAEHAWPPALRHQMLNKNYLEFQHALASVPHKPAVRFYPTETERAWAKKERAKMGECVVLWQLAGSSRMHKSYPYLDPIVARLMISYPQVHVVLTGGEECVLLEAGWGDEPRVHCRAAKWSMRQTLTFIDYAQVLIGPETGVMNAACGLPMPKIVLLSHSTHENLTRDWVNTVALSAPDVSCPGRGENEAPSCHQLHYTFEHCRRDEETGVSVCMAQIHPARTWECLQTAILTGQARSPDIEVPRLLAAG